MLDITLLGCGGAMPLPGRALSALCVRSEGSVILFDCGEGTQAAARAAGVSLYKIDMICLTHCHGDHIFGLPGLLQTMGSLGRTAPVALAGPKGFAAFINPLLAVCGPLPFAVQPVELCAAAPSQQLALAGLLPAARGWQNARLAAYTARHRTACCAYRLELCRTGRFDPVRAQALGVPRPAWKSLQQGQSVQTPGGLVQPCQVLGAPRRGLTVAFSGDTRPCAGLVEAARGADLLVCDATYGDEAQLPKAREYGHCTFAEAAAVAAQAGAARLWLTHYSAAIRDPQQYLPAAQSIYPAAECGFDGKALSLPFCD